MVRYECAIDHIFFCKLTYILFNVVVDVVVILLLIVIIVPSLEDLVAHEEIVKIITSLIDSDNLPHLLLYGPPGTGKVGGLALDPHKLEKGPL